MSSDKIPKSERSQTITAVLLMSLFAAIFIVAGLPKENITSFACSYVGDYDGFAGMCSDLKSTPELAASGEFVASKINSVCVDDKGLKISAVFDEPLTGEVHIQIYSMGPDFFPSERGMTDTYELITPMVNAVDHVDYVIPVESLSVGEQIFGNIVVSEEGISSHVAYFMNVSDCSTTSTFPSNLATNGIPIIHSATCLPSGQLMIAFEFEESVPGQYQVLVADTPYELASIINQPAMLFFSGDPPPDEPVVIKLTSATDQVVVFEETYTPPVCAVS